MGQRAAVARLSVWQPFPAFPMNVPVCPDGNVYAVALIAGPGERCPFWRGAGPTNPSHRSV